MLIFMALCKSPIFCCEVKYAKFDAKILISESEQEKIKIQTEKIKQITIKEDS